MNDAGIIEKFFARDESGLRDLMDTYGGKLKGLAVKWAYSPEDGEECLNDTYLAAWNSIPPNRPENLFAYLAKILKNHAVSLVRRNHAEKRGGDAGVIAPIDELSETLSDGRDFTKELEAEELGAFISRFLSTEEKPLPRRVFIRRYFYEDSIAEIAEAFQIGESKTKTMLLRTRNKLKTAMEKEGYYL